MSEPAAAADRLPVAGADALLWGVKTSFIEYLVGMQDTQSSVSGGAAATSRRRFLFPLASADEYDAATGLGTLKFAGDIRFRAHMGMLFVAFIEPWITIEANAAHLSIADPDHFPDTTRRLPLVDLADAVYEDAEGVRSWAVVPTALRAEAVEFFNNVYPAGEAFDLLDLRITVST